MSKSVATAATVSAARRVQVVLVGMLMTLLAAISLSAWAQPGPPGQGERGPGMRWPGAGDRAPGAGWTHHGAFHGGRDGGFDFRGSPERIGRAVDHMLDGLNASDAQRTQIKQIAVAGRGRPARPSATAAARCASAACSSSPRRRSTPRPPNSCASRCCSSTTRSSQRMTQAMLDVARC